MNCYPRKGVIRKGSDADIVIWDPSATKTVSAKTQVSRIEYNVFEGLSLKGLPSKVFLRGKLAVEDGEVVAKRGGGKFIPRDPLPASAKALQLRRQLTKPKPVIR